MISNLEKVQIHSTYMMVKMVMIELTDEMGLVSALYLREKHEARRAEGEAG